MHKPKSMIRKFQVCLLCLFLLAVGSTMVACSGGDDEDPVIDTPDDDPDDEEEEVKLPVPPEFWTEHWHDHRQTLERVYYDDDLVVYYDKDVDHTVRWPFQYIGDVWRYTKKTYGGYGDDPRLWAVFHTGRHSGGHPGYYFDDDHDNRNAIDCGDGTWLTQEGNIDLPTHEVFHIVESASFGAKGSPGFGDPPNGVWGDSKFAEIYQYDVYLGLGLTAEANRWKDHVMNQVNNNPKALTYWFRDWFYPIYTKYGKTKVLVEYFKLQAKYFPKDANNHFTRQMNWGEFVHFFSGAAKTDLQETAETAFGWTTEMEGQLYQAKIDFPDITY